MSTTRFWLRRSIRNRTRTGAFALFAVAAACTAPSLFGVLRTPVKAQAHPGIRTDKAGYLAGESVAISGGGFLPFESISLVVTHPGGGAEASAGHERFFVTADANGAFTAKWAVSATDRAGAHFIVSASSASGGSAQAAFARTGAITLSTNRTGGKSLLSGKGFNPNELISISVGNGNQPPITTTSDSKGHINAELSLLGEEANASAIKVTTGDSMMVLNLSTSDYFVVVDQNGAADVPGQVDMTEMGRLDGVDSYDVFMSWASTNSWTGSGSSGDACALFDTDGDSAGNINLAVCGEVQNQNGNVNFVVQTAASPFVFTCSNKRNDRCSTPAPWTAAQIAAAVQSGTLADLTKNGNLITTTDPFTPGKTNSTLRIKILKSALPANAKLVNLCSYPSAGNGGNNNPFDCIVPPGGNGFIQVNKVAPNADTQTFTFNVAGGASLTRVLSSGNNWTTGGLAVPIGTYSITETPVPNWTFAGATCTDGSKNSGTTPSVTGLNVTIGSATTCTFTNNGVPAHLVLTKSVINNVGGTAVPTSFILSAGGGPSPTSGPGGFSADVKPGTYTLSESGPGGYNSSGWSCTGATVNASNQITLGLGQTATCSITNTDQAAHLKLVKNVVNNSGLTTAANAFTLSAAGPTPISGAGGVEANVAAGAYTLSETTLTGYTASGWSCTNGVVPVNNQITLALNQSTTCTITNTDSQAKPTGTTVQKWVISDTFKLTGARPNSPAPAASVKFTLYSDAGCTLTVAPAETVGITVDASGNGTAVSSGVTVPKVGSYYWIAEYSGDKFNQKYATACGSEVTTITAIQ